MRQIPRATRFVLVFVVLVASATLRARLGHLTTTSGRQPDAGFVTDSGGAAPAGSMPVVQLPLGSVQSAASTSRRNHFSPQELADIGVAVRNLAVGVSALPVRQTNRLLASYLFLSTITRAPPC